MADKAMEMAPTANTTLTTTVTKLLPLLLTTASVFLSAWTILGSIAAPGGTVFALLVLIVLALVGGQTVKLAGVALTKIFRVNISLPPLLGWDQRESQHFPSSNYFFFLFSSFRTAASG